MIIGIAFIVLIIFVLALMLTSYDAGKKDAEKRLKHVLNVMNDYPLSEGYLDEHLDKPAVWRKCIREVMIFYQELSDL